MCEMRIQATALRMVASKSLASHAAATKPSEGPLDHPPAGKYGEAFDVVGAADNLEAPRAETRQCVAQILSCIGAAAHDPRRHCGRDQEEARLEGGFREGRGPRAGLPHHRLSLDSQQKRRRRTMAPPFLVWGVESVAGSVVAIALASVGSDIARGVGSRALVAVAIGGDVLTLEDLAVGAIDEEEIGLLRIARDAHVVPQRQNEKRPAIGEFHNVAALRFRLWRAALSCSSIRCPGHRRRHC